MNKRILIFGSGVIGLVYGGLLAKAGYDISLLARGKRLKDLQKKRLILLTPCVYPMLPITAGIISRANVGGSKLRALGLSCIHVFGMASTYAALGVFAAASGH